MPEPDREFTFSDQRRDLRIPFKGDVKARPLSGTGVWWFRLHPIHGVAVSISRNGSRMVLHTDEPMHVGSRLRLSVAVPSPKKTFHFDADIRWQRRHDDASAVTVGLEIIKLPEAEVNAWNRLVGVLSRTVQNNLQKHL